MKDIIMLIKQRKEFYLAVLVLTLIISVCGAIYNLSVETKSIGSDINLREASRTQVETLLEEKAYVFSEGLNSEALMRGFLNNYTYMGYIGINFVIIVVIIFSYFNLADDKTREFMETLPVKKLALELYNYVAIAGIFFLNVIVISAIHLLCFSNYNGEITALAERFPELLGDLVPGNLVTANNLSFLYQMSMVTMFLFAGMTFLFFFTAIFRKWYVGLLLGNVVWFSMSDFLANIWFWFHDEWSLSDSFLKKVSVFDIEYYFENYRWNESICSNTYTGYVVLVLGVMIVLMILSIIVHAYLRELSKGKIFYLSFLNIVLMVFGGVYFFVHAEDSFLVPMAVILTVIAETAVIYYLYHKKRKVYKLTVIEKQKVRHPVVAQNLKRYLIGTGLLVFVTELIDIDINLEPCRHFFYDAIVWSGYDPWYLEMFKMEYRFQYAMFIVAGFIIFKCIQFSMERTKTSREFYETLPVSRLECYRTQIKMDLSMVIMALIVFTAVSTGYLLHFNKIACGITGITTEITATTLVEEQFVLFLIMLCIIIFVMGILYFIDAVTVGGGMKIIFFAVTGFWTFISSVAVLEWGENLIFYELFTLLWGSLRTLAAFVYLLIGSVLLIVSATLYQRRDKAKEIFYYDFAKYILAAMLSASYLLFIVSSIYTEQAIIKYVLSLLGAILIFFLILYYCTPEHFAEKQRKFGRKKKMGE